MRGVTLPVERPRIRVVDLPPEREAPYFVCLEDWPGADLAHAGDHKARWYAATIIEARVRRLPALR